MKSFLRLFVLITSVVSASSGAAATAHADTAIFAGGCFWCMQPAFDHLREETHGQGVQSTVVGYTGGHKDKPNYEEVSGGQTGHREAIEVKFDPAKVPYSRLLDIFWANVDPTDAHGQFCDKGEQYTSAIFYQNEEQKKLALASAERVKTQLKVAEPIVTAILPAKSFYAAEDYHQGYSRKNPVRYRFYRFNCGRDQRLKSVWGKASGH
ncbi:MAG: peptide-methionine (S)-S-oxide reductase MsrA [Methylotenera sp.]|nr:peptide-methionine (S)-S-oxide reductase MsrA [Oligoflexia bacterium]